MTAIWRAIISPPHPIVPRLRRDTLALLCLTMGLTMGLSIACSVAALVLYARTPARAVARAAPPQPLYEASPRGREADDVGRFLGGLPGSAGSPFEVLERQEAWIAHRRALNTDWNRVKTGLISEVEDFQNRELSAAAIGNAPVFYPFSGPDALMVSTLFPRAPLYVLVGLEPPGTLPTFDQISRKNLERYLEDVRSTVYSPLHRSFFVTREMDGHFRGQVSDGLLPALLHLLARTGQTVLGYRYVRLDEGGRIATRDVRDNTPGNRGVEIDFQTDAGRPVRKLLYFSVNLSDERLRGNAPFLRFLAGMKGMITFFKATSYMTHRKEFSALREHVLAQSTAVLQDDSGIPYRFFGAGNWHVQLYGAYAHPYGSFRWLEQPDLRLAYAKLTPKPLDFHIGYGFARIPSNLLVARRGLPAR